MIIGLLHYRNRAYLSRVNMLLESIAARALTASTVLCINSLNFETWRSSILLNNAVKKIDGIVIFDEYVPAPVIHRTGYYKDLGICDNLYGNFDKRWKDSDLNGIFEVSEMPEEYTQDAWVSRMVPYSMTYDGIGLFKSLFVRFFNTGTIGKTRSYSYMLDYWKMKLDNKTAKPLDSFVATADISKTGPDGTDSTGFPLNVDQLSKDGVFDKMLGNWPVKYTDPSKGEGINYAFYNNNLGTHYHSAHSASISLGDLRFDVAYNAMKASKGASLLLLYACSVGEWNKTTNQNVIANIFNSRENNNIKCICSSGLLQWGGSFQAKMDGLGSWGAGDSAMSPYHADNLFTIMKKHRGRPFGEAHKEWINLSYKHYRGKAKLYPGDNKDYGGEILMNNLAMNCTGDASIIL